MTIGTNHYPYKPCRYGIFVRLFIFGTSYKNITSFWFNLVSNICIQYDNAL